jgi:hypothetical protein
MMRLAAELALAWRRAHSLATLSSLSDQFDRRIEFTLNEPRWHKSAGGPIIDLVLTVGLWLLASGAAVWLIAYVSKARAH